MKIKVSFTVDIDPEAWADEYGTEVSELRRDVQMHAEQSIRSHFDSIGVLQ